jgi:hypothetical protein
MKIDLITQRIFVIVTIILCVLLAVIFGAIQTGLF